MKTAGIIAEYNPITNGHIYHLEKTRQISKADFVVAVMSGDFTQRGMPAVMDKWTRSRLAAECGIDLVVELPFVYATGSAEMFARGGIGILEGLGAVDTVSFGSESGDIDSLKRLADHLISEPDEYKEALKKNLMTGMSFPAARQLAVCETAGAAMARLLEEPNNILATEYLKQIRTLTPVTIERMGSYNDDRMPGGDAFASASAVRVAAEKGRFDELEGAVPENCLDELRKRYRKDCGCIAETPARVITEHEEKAASEIMHRYFDMLRAAILRSSCGELSQIAGVSEGIENRIKREIRNHESYDSYAGAIKSKRFTRTAVDRMLLHILTGLTTDFHDVCKGAKDNSALPLYARVLAFNEKGAQLIKRAKKSSVIPIITNINKTEITDPAVSSLLSYDILAADIYNIICGKDLYQNSEYVSMPCCVR